VTNTVLLLGHSGLIGRVLHAHLRASGWHVVGASTRECNLLDEDRCAAFFRALPGQCHVVMASVINRSVEDSHSAMTRNIAMMRNVCAQLDVHPPKSLVLLSTVDVYGTSPQVPVTEDTRLAPSSYYALGKLACEFLPSVMSTRAFPVTTLRLPGVYGTAPDEASIVARFMRTLAARGTVVIHGDGSILRDFVHVADVCEVVRRVLELPQPGVFNIAKGKSLTLLEIIDTLAAAVGAPPRLEFDAHNSASAGSLVFDTRKLREAFPGLTFVSVQDGASRLAAEMARPADLHQERT
jgi:UDP-glucose 4-epimerase